MASLSTVIVTHDSRPAVDATVRALLAQMRSGDELIVVDNASTDGVATALGAIAPEATVIEAGSNLGFAGACNLGAETATGELLCLLNPDAVPQDGWRDAIELPSSDGRGWDAWQALVTAAGGHEINTRGGVLHFTGIGWAGGAGLAIEGLSADQPLAMPDPGFISGACLVISRHLYGELEGMPEPFFLYHEDVDLSLRVRLAGGRLGVESAARVDHEYEFDKGAQKWLYLERNRWATLIRTYPASLLALLAPALLATELALLFAAAAGGWLPQKARAWVQTLGSLPRLLAERRRIQARRSISAAQFADGLTSQLDSQYLGAAGRSRALGAVLGLYWGLVRRLLAAGNS